MGRVRGQGECVCGHLDLWHHTSIMRTGAPQYGECLAYGFNESGGLKMTWTGRVFLHFKPTRRRDFMRHIFRRPWWTVHCIAYQEEL